MFNRKFKVYLITNLKNGTQYVGVTIQDLRQRWSQHCNTIQPNKLYPAIQEYGVENFKMEVIFQATDIDTMIGIEDYFIKYYNTLSPNGYNLRDGGVYGKFTEEVKTDMSAKLKIRWETKPELFKNSLIALKKYTDNKQEKIIGINIKDSSIIKFNTINAAMENGYFPMNVLLGQSNFDHDYHWFYNEGQSDEHFINLTKEKLGEFGTYSKGENSWNKSNYNERIKAMEDASAWRAKPLVAVSRFDGSIKEFKTVNQAIKAGYTWGSVRQSLTRECKHAYDMCWFYKDESINYLEESKKILGSLYSDTNIKPFTATNGGEVIKFNKLDDVTVQGFDKKAVRQVLTGRRKSYKNYTWKFI